eukprot:CAMPEP_0170432566 /NCGR_PEP_ID=MMETSP0117_2-20130122/42019_1 /TAXON_ID=400756 /ORGANISM="Durinskia baltica, Strain CSIRO CS-38" /LENGTH=74 /DNA_ID=CAMNT_0010692229 /DNA_START=646 /DNA_END=866 /DNA_ORIENTATION=+
MNPPIAIRRVLQLSFDDRGTAGARIRSVNFLESTDVYLESSIPQNTQQIASDDYSEIGLYQLIVERIHFPAGRR